MRKRNGEERPRKYGNSSQIKKTSARTGAGKTMTNQENPPRKLQQKK